MAFVLGDALEICCRPFPGAEPCGEDAKYDPLFQDLRTEVQKLTALSSTEGGVDWTRVKEGSIQVLSERSKDLTAASYLTLALLVKDGYGGLADGLELVHRLLQDHWEGLFPPARRMRSRVLALEWLVDRLGLFVGERTPTAAEAAAVQAARDRTLALRDVVQDRLAHEAPSFGALLEGLTAHAEAAAPSQAPPSVDATAPAEPATTTEPAAANGSEAAPAPARAPRPASSPPPASAAPAPPPAADAGADDLRTHLLKVVAPLRAAQPTSPVPYRILRSIKWDELAGPPPADPGSGKTRVPAPRSHQRGALEALAAGGRWAELLTGAEGAFQEPSGTFWLDLQHYTFASLDKLGAARAAAVVKEELTSLLARFPNLPDLSFADDSPFAADATRAWLEEVARPSTSLLVGRSDGDGPEPAALGHDEQQEALRLFAAKSPAAAFSILQDAMERAASPRARFSTRLLVGRICLEANQAAWARTLLEELVTEMENFSFERWERRTAVEVLQLLAVCYARLSKSRKEDREALREQLETIRARLFRLDMRAAAAIDEMLR